MNNIRTQIFKGFAQHTVQLFGDVVLVLNTCSPHIPLTRESVCSKQADSMVNGPVCIEVHTYTRFGYLAG